MNHRIKALGSYVIFSRGSSFWMASRLLKPLSAGLSGRISKLVSPDSSLSAWRVNLRDLEVFTEFLIKIRYWLKGKMGAFRRATHVLGQKLTFVTSNVDAA